MSDAASLKNEGNQALARGDYETAVAKYTEAISLDAHNEVYFANRAQAHIKTEAYGLAIADASEAIRLNPKYTKAYYRRAVASSSIAKHKDALRDFRTAVEQAPDDPGAKARYLECQKLNRRIAFEKAIEVEQGPSVLETVDVLSMAVDSAGDEGGYQGPELQIEPVAITEEDRRAARDQGKVAVPLRVNMTPEFVAAMLQRFKTGKLIPRKYVYAIVLAVYEILQNEPTMVEVEGVLEKEGTTLTICGDTHGQFFDLLDIFRMNGPPSPTNRYLFNGDIVDRGSWSCEIALTLYSYKLLYPDSMLINRGNHETDSMNQMYGFEGECKHKYKSDQVFRFFSESFSALPLASLIEGQYLVVHGGLFSNDDVTLDDIRKINRLAQKQPGQEGVMMELLWTDPQPEPGRAPSKRGAGLQFGPDVTKRFCERNNLKAVIRSHEVRMGGYSEEHDGKLITVFSAPNYCDSTNNLGAFIRMTATTMTRPPKLNLDYKTFRAVPHPNIKPMAYASRLMA